MVRGAGPLLGPGMGSDELLHTTATGGESQTCRSSSNYGPKKVECNVEINSVVRRAVLIDRRLKQPRCAAPGAAAAQVPITDLSSPAVKKLYWTAGLAVGAQWSHHRHSGLVFCASLACTLLKYFIPWT